MRMPNLSAVILAGGASSRMGRDKAWIEVDSQSLITRALGTVRSLDITEIFVSGRRDTDYSALQCTVLLDGEPGLGPLAGIERSLDATQNSLLLVLAVDLPGMNAGFLAKLVAQCDGQTGVIPELSGQLEPLAAIYPKACHPLARDRLQQRRLSVRDFARACHQKDAVKTFAVCAADAGCFKNCNQPSDLSW
jgi:molybdenum cofactor guanylyltransferase